MAIEKLYHICNLSSKIIFRTEDDYLMAINRLAVCAYVTDSKVYAFTILSTHFHLIIESENIDRFISLYKRHITSYHNTKYKANIRLSVSHRELISYSQIIIATNYVLKNPIHHKLVEVAFRYPYSSVGLYYQKQIERESILLKQTIITRIIKPSELKSREKKKLFGRTLLPDNYKILERKLVLPECFVKVHKIQSLYESTRQFIYNMTKSLEEESKEYEISSASLFGKVSDRELCSIIDSTIAPKTYTQITEYERITLWNKVHELGVSKYQFERALAQPNDT